MISSVEVNPGCCRGDFLACKSAANVAFIELDGGVIAICEKRRIHPRQAAIGDQITAKNPELVKHGGKYYPVAGLPTSAVR